METTPYSARRLPDGKWAVFRGEVQHTLGGSYTAARAWANTMNKAAARRTTP